MHKELSIPKNPIIGNVFFRLGLIERYGTGVQRIQALYRESESQAIFEVADNLINIELPLLKGITQNFTDKATQTIPKTTPKEEDTTPKTTPRETQKEILSLIKENNKITAQEIADKIGITRDGVRYHLDNLKNKGIIKHYGIVQNGYWKVLIDEEKW